MSLLQRFCNDQRQIIPRLSRLHFIQIHKHRDERRLPVGGKERLDLILDGLDAALHFFAHPHLRHTIDFIFGIFPADGQELVLDLALIFLAGNIDEGSQMGQADGLAAIGV